MRSVTCSACATKVQDSGLKTRDETPAESHHKMCKHGDAALDCSELNKHI